jgi:hypothetical protein
MRRPVFCIYCCARFGDVSDKAKAFAFMRGRILRQGTAWFADTGFRKSMLNGGSGK